MPTPLSLLVLDMARATDGVFEIDGQTITIPDDVWIIDRMRDAPKRAPMSEEPPHFQYEMSSEQRQSCYEWHGYYPVPDEAGYLNDCAAVKVTRYEDMSGAGWYAEIVLNGGDVREEHLCAGEVEAIRKALTLAQNHHMPLVGRTETVGI